jgi:hypothetical protein
MAFFLKKTTLKGRTYLAIYESFYSHEKKGTAHRSYKSLGSVETLMKNGMDDPIAHYQSEVAEMNAARTAEGTRKISDDPPVVRLGYFPFKGILETLGVKKYINMFDVTNDFGYKLYDLLSSLVYARIVNPCSKHRTFHEVLPRLFDRHGYSYDQLLDGLAFLGTNCDKFLEIFAVQTGAVVGLDTSTTYFDCTNFYFEIDREDDFRRKGPSKENRKDPIVGLGLLLDARQIPIGMKMYPGNESEKPVIREVISELKSQNGITGRTIHVADKGINCAKNIAFSKKNGDGYIFSKSVKTLPAKEKAWILLDQGWTEVKDRDGKVLYSCKSCVDKFPYEVEHDGGNATVLLTERRLLTYNPSLATKKRFEINRMVEKAKALTLSQAKKEDYGESAKYVKFTDGKGMKATVGINQEAIDKDLMFAGYNLIVTSETKMKDTDIYNTYHNLWRIEESFRIMKSDLSARPVFLHSEDAIKGHFLICYLAVLLERILQVIVLGDNCSASEIFRFARDFNVTKGESKYINTATNTRFIKDLATLLDLPLTNYFLSETQIKSILNSKITCKPLVK